MSDYFDRVEQELRLAAGRRGAPVVQPPRVRLRLDGLVAALSVGIAIVIAVLAFSLRHHPSPPGGSGHHAQQDLSVQRHVGPTLRELMANFAVLRRPPTAADHAAVAKFTVATNRRPEVPEYVRLAGIADGIHVYFVVYPIFRNGSSGPVVAHQMHVMASGGNGYEPGNYLIFPSVIGGFGQPTAYLSVVPDGVRAVRWHFACPDGLSGCRLPPERVAVVSVHDNLAVLSLPAIKAGTSYAEASRVTWYRTHGSSTVFTNPDSAVPFNGAPPWPIPRSAKRRHH